MAGNGNVSYSGDGVQATATAVDRPEGVTVDSAGNLYISETSSARVRKVNPSGVISTVAGLTTKTPGFSGDGGPGTAATLYGPIGMAVDQSGNLYIADNVNGRVRKVDPAGIITTYAGIGGGTASTPIGDGGPATSAYIGVCKDVALDASGNLYIAGSAGGIARVRKVTVGGGLSVNPGSLSFSFTIGGAAPASQTVSVTTAGAALGFSASASTTSGSNWLSVSPTSGTTAATLTVSVNPAGIPGGVYQGAVTLTPSGSGGAAQTFSVTLTVTGAGAPAFTAGGVLNALGYQAKLAPDTVFVIFGSGMGPSTLAAAAGPNYPATLGGTSITFTPTGGGAAINAKMVYSVAGQVAGLLPSSIAPGTYAVRVTYGTLPSAPQNVTVVARSFGIATANSAGTGTAQATIGNVNGGVSLTRFTSGSVAFGGLDWTLSPAHPGDTLVLWGTGGGADPANDTGGTSGDQTQAGNFSVIVSGRQITPLYAGASSGYPGLWQVNFTLPADIAPDCFASVQVSAGGEVSNTVSIPIAGSGQGVCADPQLSGDALALLDKGGTVVGGGFGIAKLKSTNTIVVSGGTTSTITVSQESISGGFAVYTGAEYAAIYAGIKIGSCTVTDRTAAATAKNPARTGGLSRRRSALAGERPRPDGRRGFDGRQHQSRTCIQPAAGGRHDRGRRQVHDQRERWKGRRSIQRVGEFPGQLHDRQLGLAHYDRPEQTADTQLDQQRVGPDLHRREHFHGGWKGRVEREHRAPGDHQLPGSGRAGVVYDSGGGARVPAAGGGRCGVPGEGLGDSGGRGGQRADVYGSPDGRRADRLRGDLRHLGLFEKPDAFNKATL